MPQNFLETHHKKFVFLCFLWEIQTDDIIWFEPVKSEKAMKSSFNTKNKGQPS